MIPSGSKQKFKGNPALYKWPGQQGGKRIPPIKDELFQNKWPTPDNLLDLFQPYVDSIRVFDITQNSQRGNLSIRIFCNLLEGAQQTCSFRKAILGASQSNHTEVRKNVARRMERIFSISWMTRTYKKNAIDRLQPLITSYWITARLKHFPSRRN